MYTSSSTPKGAKDISEGEDRQNQEKKPMESVDAAKQKAGNSTPKALADPAGAKSGLITPTDTLSGDFAYKEEERAETQSSGVKSWRHFENQELEDAERSKEDLEAVTGRGGNTSKFAPQTDDANDLNNPFQLLGSSDSEGDEGTGTDGLKVKKATKGTGNAGPKGTAAVSQIALTIAQLAMWNQAIPADLVSAMIEYAEENPDNTLAIFVRNIMWENGIPQVTSGMGEVLTGIARDLEKVDIKQTDQGGKRGNDWDGGQPSNTQLLIQAMGILKGKKTLKFQPHTPSSTPLAHIAGIPSTILKVAKTIGAVTDSSGLGSNQMIRETIKAIGLGNAKVQELTPPQWTKVFEHIRKDYDVEEVGSASGVIRGIFDGTYGSDVDEASTFIRMAEEQAAQAGTPFVAGVLMALRPWANEKCNEEPEEWGETALTDARQLIKATCKGHPKTRALGLISLVTIVEAAASASSSDSQTLLTTLTKKLAKTFKTHAVNPNHRLSPRAAWKPNSNNTDGDGLTDIIVDVTKEYFEGTEPNEGERARKYLSDITKAAKFYIEADKGKVEGDKESNKNKHNKKKGGGDAKEVRINAATTTQPARQSDNAPILPSRFNKKHPAKLGDELTRTVKPTGACFDYFALRLEGCTDKEAVEGCNNPRCKYNRDHVASKAVYEEHMDRTGKGVKKVNKVSSTKAEDSITQDQETEEEVRSATKSQPPNEPEGLTLDTPRSNIKGQGGLGQRGGGRESSNLGKSSHQTKPTSGTLDSGAGANITDVENIIEDTLEDSPVMTKGYDGSVRSDNKQGEAHLNLKGIKGNDVRSKIKVIAPNTTGDEPTATLLTEETIKSSGGVVVGDENCKAILIKGKTTTEPIVVPVSHYDSSFPFLPKPEQFLKGLTNVKKHVDGALKSLTLKAIGEYVEKGKRTYKSYKGNHGARQVKIQATSPASPVLSDVETPGSDNSHGSEEPSQNQENESRDIRSELDVEVESIGESELEQHEGGADIGKLKENEQDLTRFRHEIIRLRDFDGTLITTDMEKAREIRARIHQKLGDHRNLPEYISFSHRLRQEDKRLRDVSNKIKRMRKNGKAADERRAREHEEKKLAKERKEKEDREREEYNDSEREKQERLKEREAARRGIGALLEAIEGPEAKEDAELVICTFTGAKVIGHDGNKDGLTLDMELEGRFMEKIPHSLAVQLSKEEVEKYIAETPGVDSPKATKKRKIIEIPYEELVARSVDIERKLRHVHVTRGHQSYGQMRREWQDPNSYMRKLIGPDFPLSFITLPCDACNRQRPKPKRGTVTFTGPGSSHGLDREDMFVGQMVSIDGVEIPRVGEEPWRGHGGAKSAVMATDLKTRFVWVVGSYASKANMNDVRKVLNIVDHDIVTHNGAYNEQLTRTVRTDSFTAAAKGVGQGTHNLTLQGRLSRDKGAKLTTSLPHEQWGNFTENNNRKIRQMSHKLMNHARNNWGGFPEYLRMYAITHAALLINIKIDHHNTTRPNADIALGTSPYEQLKGRPFNEKNLHTFGARAWYTDEYKKSKGQDKRKVGYHLGISAEEQGWYIYCPDTDRVIATRNACFDDMNELAGTQLDQREAETFEAEDRNTNFITLTDEITPNMVRQNLTLTLREDVNRDIGAVEVTGDAHGTTEERLQPEEDNGYLDVKRVEVKREGDIISWTEVSDYLQERTPVGLDERLIVMVNEDGEELTLITNQTFHELQEQAKHDPEGKDMQWEGDHDNLGDQLLKIMNELDDNGVKKQEQEKERDEGRETECAVYGVETEQQEARDQTSITVGPQYKPPKHRHEMSHDPYKKNYKIAEATELRKLGEKGFIEYWTEEKYKKYLKEGGNKAIPFRWAYNIKTSKEELGRVEVFKARLALRGDLQKDNYLPHEKYAPVASQETIRTVMTIGLMFGMHHYQYDAPAAFLNAEPSRPIVCLPIPGYTVRDTRGNIMYPYLKKNLYGSVEAGKRWADVVTAFLLKHEFTQTITDPTVFVHEERMMTCVVYVDDFSLGFKEDKDRLWIEKEMSDEYDMKMEGPISNYIGVRYTKTERGYFMDQEIRVKALAARLGVKEGRNTRTPYKTVKPFSKLELDDHEETRKDLERIYGFDLRSVVGELLHLAQTTRPDISVAASSLASHVRMVSDQVFREILRAVRYLLTTSGLGLHITTEDKEEGVTAHVDASYMSDRNAHGLSRYGMTMSIGDTIVAWKTGFLPKTHTSTTAAEFQTLNIGAEKAMEIHALAEEVKNLLEQDHKEGVKPQMKIDPRTTIRPVTIREDNEPAANAAKSRKGANFETRQTAAAYWKIRAAIMEGRVNVKVVGTKYQIADFLTKKLTPKEFERLRGFYVRAKHDMWPPALKGGGKILGREEEEGHNM
jgi:hypothetical protein